MCVYFIVVITRGDLCTKYKLSSRYPPIYCTCMKYNKPSPFTTGSTLQCHPYLPTLYPAHGGDSPMFHPDRLQDAVTVCFVRDGVSSHDIARLLINVSVVFMFPVPKAHLPQNQPQCCAATTKYITVLQLCQKAL